MKENIEIPKKNNKLEALIGILLIIPIYMLIFVILNLQGDNKILFPLLMYLPIVIGRVLSYKNYNSKINKSIDTCILIFLSIAIFCFFNTYFIDYSGFDNIGYMFCWLISTAILRIFSCIFYGKLVGRKKAIIFSIIYVLSVVFSFAFGFWA